MSNKLCNILVPVDFTSKNKWAIAKGMEMANQMNCNLHLVNIVQPNMFSSFTPYESHVDRLNSYDQLKDLAVSCSSQLCGNGKIEISLLEGNTTNKLVEYIRDFEMDMVVMGLSSNLFQRIISSSSINKIAKKTNVPVLAVGSKGLVHHFKKIILPLYDELSLRRIKMATTLAHSFKSTIYMVTLRQGNNTPEKIIREGLEIAKSLPRVSARGIILEGDNLAQKTIEFAKRINGDLIMINPADEFKLPGWWSKFTNKILSYGSGIPVMTMSKQ
ncbi:MAG TPA: universal stress protein [Chitinophagaceae bacterium]|nr:universal stress protein [Chitinophagaceae bacterium]